MKVVGNEVGNISWVQYRRDYLGLCGEVNHFTRRCMQTDRLLRHPRLSFDGNIDHMRVTNFCIISYFESVKQLSYWYRPDFMTRITDRRMRGGGD